MPACQAKNFDVAILGTQSPYAVVAEYQGLTADGHFPHDALQPDWAEIIRVLAATQTPPGESFILNIGGLLFDDLMQGSIRDLWVEARAGLEAGQYLRVRLNLRPPAVAALPWETLADPRRRRTLAADKALALVRTATDAEFVGRPRSIQTKLPAKILIVAVEEADAIDASAEISHIQASLSPLLPTHLQLEILQGRFDLQTLRRRLDEYRPDILHVISHGETDGLYLWENDELTLVKASQLAAMLGLVDSVKLVFLNACLAGQPDNTAPYAGLAQRLLQTGIPAVIAMQFVVLDRAAAAFAGFLYEALVVGPCPGAIDVATSIARSGLYISDPDRIDYATPLLWLNAPDGMILRWTDASPQPASSVILASSPDVLPPPLVLEIEEKERWFALLPLSIERAELRFDYPDRRKQAEQILRELRQAHEAQQAGEPVDFRRITGQLKKFSTERRLVDNLLEKLQRTEP
ncbi:MAG: CHAT domain-containing protein [Chloroflexi bacterium]|nr:CHAT domain-containing protein [Chloroflexota bacterium]